MKGKNFNKLPNKGPKMIKFNIYWIYAIIFIFFIGLQFFGSDLTKKTNFKDFNNNMLQQQKVERITIVNKEKVFVYIKKENLSEDQFKEVYKQPFGNSQFACLRMIQVCWLWWWKLYLWFLLIWHISL